MNNREKLDRRRGSLPNLLLHHGSGDPSAMIRGGAMKTFAATGGASRRRVSMVQCDALLSFLMQPKRYRDERARGRERRPEKQRLCQPGDSRDKLADSLRQCESGGLPRPDNQQLLDSLCLELEPCSWDCSGSDGGAASSKSVKQQAAIWELLQTEVNILRHLKTIIEVYVTVIRHLQTNSGLLTDVATELLFPGISEVFQAHWTLWTSHLRPALAAARQEPGGRLRPTSFYRGFASFRDIFQPSAEYCMRITEAKEYLKSLDKNDAFCDFVRWAQKFSQRNYSPEDGGGAVDLQLSSLLTMPLQRIMKYGLLLQEILRHTDDGEERLALETMIGHVTSFCNQLNATYRTKCDQADLRCVADRLEDVKLHEWVESLGDDAASFLEAHRLNITRPMPHNGQLRRKLAEGDVRCKDEKGKWSDAKCLLFTDLLLLARCSKRNGLRLLKPPVRLDRLLVHRLSDNYAFLLLALTDFGSVDSLICLAGDSQKASDDWMERIGQSKAALLAQMRAPAATHASSSEQQQQQKQLRLQPQHQHQRSFESLQPAVLQRQHQVTSQQQQHLQSPHLSQQQRSSSDAADPPPSGIWLRQRAAGLHYTHSSCDMDSLQMQQQQLQLQTEDSASQNPTAAAAEETERTTSAASNCLPMVVVLDSQELRRSSHV